MESLESREMFSATTPVACTPTMTQLPAVQKSLNVTLTTSNTTQPTTQPSGQNGIIGVLIGL